MVFWRLHFSRGERLMFLLQRQTTLRNGLEVNLDAEMSEPITDDLDTEQAVKVVTGEEGDDLYVETGENGRPRFDDEGNEVVDDRVESGYPADDLGLDAFDSVRQWQIRAVGKRPQDFIARDCLFGSLFRDYRATWFHRYLQRPSEWMKELVAHLPFDEQPGPRIRRFALPAQDAPDQAHRDCRARIRR